MAAQRRPMRQAVRTTWIGHIAMLHCCLAGFDADEALDIERLAAQVKPQLSAAWSFSAAHADACDLLLCNLDAAPGGAAWLDGAHRAKVCAAATFDPAVPDRLTLRRPVRAHGADGLVHVLNSAAQSGSPAASTGQVAGAAPAPVRPGRLRSLLRALFGWWPRPAAHSPAPSVPQATEAEVSPDPVEEAAEPLLLRDAGILLPSRLPPGRAAAPGVAARETAAAGGLTVLPPAGRRVPRAPPMPGRGTIVLDAMGCDLLTLLRRSRAASQVIVFRLDGIPAICAAPLNETCYTLASLQAVYDSPDDALVPGYVTVAQNSYYGRTAVQGGAGRHIVTIPDLPLKHLFWVAVLRCGGSEEIARYGEGAFSLPVRPDFASLPHARHHIAWCGLLGRKAMTAVALGAATGHDAGEAAIFLAACDELGLLQRKGLPAGLTLGSSADRDRMSDRAMLSGPGASSWG